MGNGLLSRGRLAPRNEGRELEARRREGKGRGSLRVRVRVLPQPRPGAGPLPPAEDRTRPAGSGGPHSGQDVERPAVPFFTGPREGMG